MNDDVNINEIIPLHWQICALYSAQQSYFIHTHLYPSDTRWEVWWYKIQRSEVVPIGQPPSLTKQPFPWWGAVSATPAPPFSSLHPALLCFLHAPFGRVTSHPAPSIHPTPTCPFRHHSVVIFWISSFSSTPLPYSHIEINTPTSSWSHDALWVFSSCCFTVEEPAGFDLWCMTSLQHVCAGIFKAQSLQNHQ